ncbi:hypothetical protein Y88_1967 [Novosphingobium nitrogenifigens DSM 19370]|uniref:Anti-sigma factor n=1 Tax=Novosphingobium nitrogenifigens DSM 19370 TaxID=983920 RepID=F1Z5I3_9SPHN|nr:hypothetical protein [Novosphingobium nitrogenifigens]EGD60093.1 hypothetical protein Y88_1967 [Novosphingobium nitrogenifigens DSM 19370]
MTGDIVAEDREERLAAWLDDALSPADRQAFEAEMEADPALAALAVQWRENDRRIREALSGIAQRPLPEATLALLAPPDPVPHADNDNPRRMGRRIAWGLVAFGTLAAASLALFLNIGSGAAVDPLSQALDRTPSLAEASLPDGRRIVPSLTVRAADGRWCREYRSGETLTLACRGGDGRWMTEASGKGQGPESAETIAVAAGGSDAALDPAFQRLGAGDPVDAATETKLIADRWRR